MNKIRKLGLIGIISASLLGCSSEKIYNKIVRDDKVAKDYVLKQNSQTITVDMPPEIQGTVYTQNNEKEIMFFSYGREYRLEHSLVGNLDIYPISKNVNHPIKVVMYYSRKGFFQQALFAYDPYNNGYVAMVVQTDFNGDGFVDVLMLRQELRNDSQGKPTGILKLMDRPQSILMTDFTKANASLNNKYSDK
ncbi:MAG TPA: hypothetical protein VEC16_01800 [Alphaproteobacteria bacterium]|nr:hypothetical protein [Alphaproteobacteria bacterium]